ncbi:MAG TPA: DUF933 domain-containing protein [Syntrophorhabdaceae bacterium]|nr:DUF933 domain-containing protein [Syntrophorhabdaceae bacterium]
MYISIIGNAGSGKTTLFQALSGIRNEGGYSDKANLAIIDVPDERVDALTKIFKPKKTVYARIELADTVAIEEGNVQKGTISAKTLQQMRTSDAFILTVAYFDGKTSSDAFREVHGIEGEFILSDMAQIEGRIERMKKQAKKGDTTQAQEEALFEKCLAHLNEEKPLSSLSLEAQEIRSLRGFQLLSLKPMMIVVNTGEDNIEQGPAVADELQNKFPAHPVIHACAKLESELALMSDDERAEFMKEYSITESIRGRIVRLAFETLGLICFLTVGEDECRAWPIRKGSNAQEAAAAVHTDLSNRFIRAETVAYSDFMKCGSMPECKKAGVWRLEGKTYIVQDGDILNIRAGT